MAQVGRRLTLLTYIDMSNVIDILTFSPICSLVGSFFVSFSFQFSPLSFKFFPMKVLILFFAMAFYMAISDVESKPIEPAPIVYVMPRKKLNLPRRRCHNLQNIGIRP